jgi:opacity protein-like surface antigen
MNKFLLIGALILSNVCCSAQQIQLRPVVAFGSSFNTPVPDASFSDNERTIHGTSQFKASFAIGVGAAYLVGNHWSLGMDLMYSREGKTAHYKDMDYDFTDDITVKYLRLPVNINYYFRKPSKKLRPYITAGVSMGLRLMVLDGFKVNDAYTNKYLSPYLILPEDYKRIDIGMQLGFGFTYKLSQKTAVFSELKYYRGFIEPNSNMELGAYNENLRIQLGYSFCLK